MTKEIQLVIDALGKVGEKVGEGTEYFWPLLIQKVQIDWIAGFVTILITLIILIVVSLKVIPKLSKEIDNSSSDCEEEIGLMIFLFIADITLLIFLLIKLSNISCLFVPEIHVIEELMKVGGLI